MDERRFGLLLVLIIASVGVVGLLGSGLGSGITGGATMRGLLDTQSLYDRWSSSCESQVQKYNSICGEVIAGSGVQRATSPARCIQLKTQMVNACDAKDKYAQRAAKEDAPLRGTTGAVAWFETDDYDTEPSVRYVLPTGAAVGVDTADSGSDGMVAGVPLSLIVVVGIGGLFLYFRRRETR